MSGKTAALKALREFILAQRAAGAEPLVSPHVQAVTRAVAPPEARTLSPEEVSALQDAVLVSRRRLPDELLSGEGALRTVFDTGKSGARNAPLTRRLRAVREPELFAGRAGQTYAAALSDPYVGLTEGVLPTYGDYGLELKPEVKSRATVSIGDLADYGGFPRTATLPNLVRNETFPALRELALRYLELNPKLKRAPRMADPHSTTMTKADRDFWAWAGLQPIRNEYGYEFAGAYKVPRELTALTDLPLLPREQALLQRTPITDLLRQVGSPSEVDFVEAQIHGPVTAEDVARVYDYSGRPSSDLERRFRRLGIDYIPVPPQLKARGGLAQLKEHRRHG
jgi:hypothetical protein